MNRNRLISTPEAETPPGSEVMVLTRPDGVELRAARWRVPAGTEPKGTVALFHGRTEFIEKYYEVIAELQARGFAVVTFDWRGQGLSSRLLRDPLKGHVKRFDDYVRDARHVLDTLMVSALPRPHLLLAHSMGGNIALRLIQEDTRRFARVVLSAPMTDIHLGAVPAPLVRLLAGLAGLIGFGGFYALGQGPGHPLDELFESNFVTSDPARHARNLRLVRAEPALALGGVTWRWLGDGLASSRLVMSDKRTARLHVPVLLASAGEERFVDRESHKRLGERSSFVRVVPFEWSRHEILQERDGIRALFWDAFDSFVSEEYEG